MSVDLNLIKEFRIFSSILDNPEAIRMIADIIEVRHFPAGEPLITEGETGDEMFLLISGAVRVVKLTRNAEEYTVAEHKAENRPIFGELALMDADRRSASIRALEDSLTYVVHRDAFHQFGDQHPEIALPITREIAKVLCRHLRMVNADVILLFDALVNEIETSQL